MSKIVKKEKTIQLQRVQSMSDATTCFDKRFAVKISGISILSGHGIQLEHLRRTIMSAKTLSRLWNMTRVQQYTVF